MNAESLCQLKHKWQEMSVPGLQTPQLVLFGTPLNRESLPSSSLSIGKYSAIVSIQEGYRTKGTNSVMKISTWVQIINLFPQKILIHEPV